MKRQSDGESPFRHLPAKSPGWPQAQQRPSENPDRTLLARPVHAQETEIAPTLESVGELFLGMLLELPMLIVGNAPIRVRWFFAKSHGNLPRPLRDYQYGP
jgi:hypothetical protein